MLLSLARLPVPALQQCGKRLLRYPVSDNLDLPRPPRPHCQFWLSALLQTTADYDFYIEPGTHMLRAPGGSLQVLGKVVVDMKTGDVWGFPTLSADPYPIDITKPEPPQSPSILASMILLR